MARSNVAAIMDFGSQSITVLIGERGVNNSFVILGKSEVEYGGYFDGEFVEPEYLGSAINVAITTAETNARIKITELFVGVPGEFTSVVVKNSMVNFSSKRKITEVEVENLFDQEDTYKNNANYVLINRSPIYFTLDDNRMLIEPIGMKATKLGGLLSYVFADKVFYDTVSAILKANSITNVEFVSSCLAESLFLFEPHVRDRYALLIDIGYISTSVMIVGGEGLLYLKSFSLGGSYLAYDLSTCLNVPYILADNLKRKIALSLEVSDEDQYEVDFRGQKYEFPAKLVHDIVEARIEEIASMIKKCIDKCPVDFPNNISCYLTGGGISYLRGGKELLSKLLNREIEVAKPALEGFERPNLSSSYGLLDLALKQANSPAKGLFEKIFN